MIFHTLKINVIINKTCFKEFCQIKNVILSLIVKCRKIRQWSQSSSYWGLILAQGYV
jgi:hypothetical protein